MSQITEMIVTIAVAIVTLGIVSVLVSRNADTSSVVQATGSAFNNALGVAESPVTGAHYQTDLSYPGAGLGYGAATPWGLQ